MEIMNEKQSEFEFAKDFKWSNRYPGDALQYSPHETKQLNPLGTVTVEFQKIHPAAALPSKAHPGDVGYDLTVVSFEKKDFTVIAHTGLKMKLPEGYEGQIRSRSGLASKGICIANGLGSLDTGYRGEIMVILGSLTAQAPFLGGMGNKECQCGNTVLKVGDRVAQLVIAPILNTEVIEVESVDDDTERGSNGLGSSGL